ncbi:hypothetical protein ID866_13072 [Astraeus odoratus]|nr:hypothetical protein ID866_13072 [Astraeus odoratus]
MSSPCCTLSPHKTLLAKTKDPQECMEEEWHLVSEGKLDPMLSNDEHSENEEAEKRAREEAEHLAHEEAAKKVQEEAERKVQEEHKAQEEAVKREREERETAAWMAQEAAEAWADAEQRALEERLWDMAAQHSETVAAPLQVAKPGGRMSVAGPSVPGQRASGVQDPCTQCCNKGTLCVLGAAKGKTTACEVCRHVKVSCSWMKRMAREVRKKKQVCCLEEADNVEMVEASKDDEEEETQSHFAVLPHLTEEHQDAPPHGGAPRCPRGADGDPGHAVHGVL